MLYSYDWVKAEKNNPIYKESPGDDEFNPKSGHAMLYVINYFIQKNGADDVNTGNKAEYLLHECLPDSSHTLKEIIKFLEKNI
jgi:hypothetical protein